MEGYNKYTIEEFKDLSDNERLDFRKKMFDSIFRKKEIVDENIYFQIKNVLEVCPSTIKKYDIPFVKKAIEFLEKQGDPNQLIKYSEKLLELPLSNICKENHSFSEYDLAVLDLFKLYCSSKFIEKRDDLYNQMKDIVSEKTLFFIEYNLCKSYFEMNDYKKAFELYDRLILTSRDLYLLSLPLKYYSKENQYPEMHKIVLEIIILHIKKEKIYIYKYIYNWIRSLERDNDLELIIQLVSFDDEYRINISDFTKFTQYVITYIENQNKVKIYKGIVLKVFKSRNGIVQCNDDRSSYFISKKTLKFYKVNSKIRFVLFKTYKDKKIISNALIIGGEKHGKEK